MDPVWVGAIGSAVSAAAGAGAIWWSAHSFRKTNENTSRPYVSASFEAVDRDDRVYFKVGNYGKSAASEIVIDFGSCLSQGEPSGRDFGAYLREMFAAPGITLSPGETKQTIYQVAEGSQEPKEEIAPDDLSGSISYRAPARYSKKGKLKSKGARYIEGFELNAAPLKHMLRVSRSDRDVEQRLLKLTQQVSKVVVAINSLDDSVDDDLSLAEDPAAKAQAHESRLEKIRNALMRNQKRDSS